jgi:hypothetical protein
MRTLLGTYPLLNRQTGSWDDAQLFSPISQDNVDDFDKLWRPEFASRLALARSRRETLAEANLQDAHWDWPGKAKDRNSRLDWTSFGVECDSRTQGLMFVGLASFAREPSQKGDHLAYIDLLATAPWNRPQFTDRPIYKGIGPLLLGTAISLSVDEGFRGRIGLHALPQSEAWYRNVCGMTDLGPDPAYSNLHYFEMTEAQARAFVANQHK